MLPKLLGLFYEVFRENTEDTTSTINFLKSHINTSCIEIITLFAIFSDKGLGNFKLRPNYSVLKGMVLVNEMSFQA